MSKTVSVIVSAPAFIGWMCICPAVSAQEHACVGSKNCRMCNGAGATYAEPEYTSLKNNEYQKPGIVAVGMVDRVTAAQCRGCHNADSPFVGPDYVFDFEANKESGTHEKFPLKYQR